MIERRLAEAEAGPGTTAAQDGRGMRAGDRAGGGGGGGLRVRPARPRAAASWREGEGWVPPRRPGDDVRRVEKELAAGRARLQEAVTRGRLTRSEAERLVEGTVYGSAAAVSAQAKAALRLPVVLVLRRLFWMLVLRRPPVAVLQGLQVAVVLLSKGGQLSKWAVWWCPPGPWVTMGPVPSRRLWAVGRRTSLWEGFLLPEKRCTGAAWLGGVSALPASGLSGWLRPARRRRGVRRPCRTRSPRFRRGWQAGPGRPAGFQWRRLRPQCWQLHVAYRAVARPRQFRPWCAWTRKPLRRSVVTRLW